MVSVDDIARLYTMSRATARRQLKRLEERGLIVPIDQGGGRGRSKTYDAHAIRKHFRARATPPPKDIEAMVEPIGFAEWNSQWLKYWEWKRAHPELNAAEENSGEDGHARI